MKVYVQECGYDRELTFLDDNGQVNVRLIFDVRNEVLIVRQSGWSKGFYELFMADNLTGLGSER